jgi:hypothetical protein
MELRHIRSFLSLGKTLNFSRTAEIVHLSQPALSPQIQALENEIGVKLFARDRWKTALSSAGVGGNRDHQLPDSGLQIQGNPALVRRVSGPLQLVPESLDYRSVQG